MERVSGNIYIRPMPEKGSAKEGDVIAPQHKHNFDHTMFVRTGAVRVWAMLPNGRIIERDFMSPREGARDQYHCLIRAGVEHKIIATEDGTQADCVFAHRDPQTKEVVQEWNGWTDSNV